MRRKGGEAQTTRHIKNERGANLKQSTKRRRMSNSTTPTPAYPSFDTILQMNTAAIKGIYPLVSRVVLSGSVVSVYEMKDEFKNVDCLGPLFVCETLPGLVSIIVLNQSSFGTYRVDVDPTTSFVRHSNALTISTTNASPVQFCFLCDNPDRSVQATISAIQSVLQTTPPTSVFDLPRMSPGPSTTPLV